MRPQPTEGAQKGNKKDPDAEASGSFREMRRSVTFVTTIPPVVHSIHERLRRRRCTGAARRSRRGSLTGASDGRRSEDDTRDHRRESEDSDDDAGHIADGHASDQSTDTGEKKNRPVDEIAVAESTVARRRRDDVCVVVKEMAFHLVQKTLFLFREWHVSPSGGGASSLRVSGPARLDVRCVLSRL